MCGSATPLLWGSGLQEYDEEGGFREAASSGGTQPARLRYSYFTAGSGGVGPTILETSMLLAGEEVVAYRDGQKVRRAADPCLLLHKFAPHALICMPICQASRTALQRSGRRSMPEWSER